MASFNWTWNEWQASLIATIATTCRQTRMEMMRMLLGNLTPTGIRKIQSIISKEKKKRKNPRKSYKEASTTDLPGNDEDAWYELFAWELLVNWSSCSLEAELIGFIKELIPNYRTTELDQLCASYCYHAKEAILYPERVVSRRKPEPSQVGWWAKYAPYDQNILSLDCEMVSKIVGVRSNGKKRCKQLAGTISVVDFNGTVVKKWIVKHNEKEIFMTEKAKAMTGFNEGSFANGTELNEIQDELTKLFEGKLIILIGGGMDLEVLGYQKSWNRNFDVFDLHVYFKKDSGAIGLRSLVIHYYGLDIQKGIHDSDVDAKYTMKLFREKYITEKLANPSECKSRNSSKMFNEIKTIKN